MVYTSIENAKFHGINVHQGNPNNASGDCAFEAVADNVSSRPCFNEILNSNAALNRRAWLNKTEDLVYNFCGGAGLSKSTFRKQWDELKQPGIYEHELGDYILPVIAHCTKKDILIFNTKVEGSNDPIYVVEASKLAGESANSKVPVLLAYNNVHFEGLIPNTKDDELETVKLKELYLKNNYFIIK